ncbi:3-isopropylmalate dehydrogenase [Fusibacter ferrireducens]|uniref:3-isopropylmalate dehydrogenase n=1 Tax=Fusibacter ferrireducens TaxID=2785058 RepID=A0ABS0A1A5_9FIRM|nr:3-isopropylmalate dehydrogenase [Fusibacter ferrireducens]MBF4696001.1 3-isopropylmalate dehydrogenase [Fusibacter ferrireducens]
MESYKIGILKGDGIGPEIVDEGIKVIQKIAALNAFKVDFIDEKIGGDAIDAYGVPITDETLKVLSTCEAILMGSVGDPKYDHIAPELRPEKALLKMRKTLGLFANIRPARLYEALKEHSPLKSSILSDGLDICVVRELNGGIYFGEQVESADGQSASDLMAYSAPEVKRIAKIAFEMAMTRDKKVTSVDKANVLASSRLWRKTVIEVSKDFPEVTLEHLYVDNAAMQLIINPMQFDVILTSNLFGDILSDEMSVLTGSIGLLPSASINESKLGLYEPIHGSAPSIAGQNIANPIATILSVAMMFRYSLGRHDCADQIENAVLKVLNNGHRTIDLAGKDQKSLSTSEIGDLIAEAL